MIPILVEENYSQNNRFYQLLAGIESVASKKHMQVNILQSVTALPADCRAVVLVCQSSQWSMERLAELNARGIHPLLFGFSYPDTLFDYSSVAPNYTKSSYRLIRSVLHPATKKIAFLGYNADSIPDRQKLTGIRRAAEEASVEVVLFENHGDVAACIASFAKNGGDCDVIACCNDNVAILLRTHSPALLSGRTLCSCSGLKTSEFFAVPHPVCRINYFSAGELLAFLYRFLIKQDPIHSTVMTFDEELFLPTHPSCDFSPTVSIGEQIDFYGDKSFEALEHLDRMLNECDQIDLEILSDLLRGKTYASIAEERHLAMGTVKYRVKKMQEKAGVESRQALLTLLREYHVSALSP